MARSKMKLDKKRVMAMYDKYGTLVSTALRLNCSPSKLKKFLQENDIPIKEYKPKPFNYNTPNTW
jgi:intein-encoded DNA endonuclease-like protein